MVDTAAAPSAEARTALDLALRRFSYGATGATIVAALTQPLDVIKTTQQGSRLAAGVEGARAVEGVVATLRGIHQRSGLLSLWAGLTPTVVRVFFGAGLYFSSLHSLQGALQVHLAPGWSNLLAGSLARVFAAGIMSPFSVVKTRMENMGGQPGAAGLLGTLRGLARGGQGLAALYSGLLPTLIRDAPFSGLYFFSFTLIKGALGVPEGPVAARTEEGGGWAWELPAKTFVAGLGAGALATALTHPADVLKTRLQLQPPQGGRLAVGRVLLRETGRVLQEEGPRGLFTGLEARILKRASSTAFTWTLFEEGMRRSS